MIGTALQIASSIGGLGGSGGKKKCRKKRRGKRGRCGNENQLGALAMGLMQQLNQLKVNNAFQSGLRAGLMQRRASGAPMAAMTPRSQVSNVNVNMGGVGSAFSASSFSAGAFSGNSFNFQSGASWNIPFAGPTSSMSFAASSYFW